MTAISSNISRRSLLAGSSLAVGALAVRGTSQASAEEVPNSQVTWDYEADIVIVGGGVGGTLAAYRACELGAKTLLVEAGAELGGSILISNAALHTYSHGGPITDVETLFEKCQTADKVLAADFIEKWVSFTDDWFPTIGVPNATAATGMITFGGSYADRKANFDYLQGKIAEMGGQVLLRTRGLDLVLDEEGAVTGIELVGRDGVHAFAKAPAVVLACGGITANQPAKQAFMGEYADRSVGRTVPFNLGDGHRMALKAGGQLTEGMACFYGHLVPYPSLVPTDPETYDAADKDGIEHALMRSQYIDINALVVNLDGKRFADECSSHIMESDCWAAVQMTRQPLGYGYVITDSFSEDQNPNIQELIDLGATVVVADTLDELVEELGSRGVHRGNLRRTLAEFVEKDADDLEVFSTAKANGTATKLDVAPYYAIQVTAGVSAMFGGVKIDADAHVIAHGGLPVKGLYATACCAGGFTYDDYVGSLSLSSVYGKQAVETAAAEIGL